MYEIAFLGLSLSPDEKWNLSPAVLRTLKRRLLFEVDNPLCLLKQRIINFIYAKYQMRGIDTVILYINYLKDFEIVLFIGSMNIL